MNTPLFDARDPMVGAAWQVQTGDRLVTAVANRFDVVTVHDTGKITVVDRNGHTHGPWAVYDGGGRSWFRPHANGAGTRLEPLNDNAKRMDRGGFTRLAAHWFGAWVWFVQNRPMRQHVHALNTIAEAGACSFEMLIDKLGIPPDKVLQTMADLRATEGTPVEDCEEGWRWAA